MRKLLMLISICLAFVFANAQTRVLRGKITDATGAPVSNATVQLKGTKLGTVSDATGSFSISVPQTVHTAVVSSLNYVTTEVDIKNKSNIDVSLAASSDNLNEVVVIAYGATTRTKATGSSTKIAGKQFENVPLASLDAMLQGKAAGLQSVSTSGQAASLSQIRLRGVGSISASSEPLFVIDGVPIITGDASRLQPTSNTLAGFNPDDIEEVTILKDAAATSIYGSRASNGVVLITTKSGKSGKTKFSASTEVGNNAVAYFPEIAKPLNKDQFKTLTTEGILHLAGNTQADVDRILSGYGYNSTANYNWLDLVTRKGAQQQANISATGGTNGSTFYLSGGYFRQQAPVIGADFKRYSGSFRGSLKATDKLTLNAGANVSSFHQIGEGEGSGFRNPVFTGLALRPTQEAFKADGTPEYDRTIFEQLFNPLAITSYDRIIDNTSRILANTDLIYKVLPSLSFKAKYGIDYTSIEESRYFNPYFGDARPPTNGSFFANYDRVFNYLLSTTVEYNHKFIGNKLDVNLLGGHETQKTRSNVISGGGTGVPLTTSIPFPSVSTPTISKPVTENDNSIESYLSRTILSYYNRYNLSLSFREDGSSRFADGKRWGSFWSVGGSWNIDKEQFFSLIHCMNYLKLRASYGTSGNNNLGSTIGDYPSLATYSFGGNYNGQPASSPSSVGNPTLTWEKNKSYDAGLEGGLFQSRITFDVGYYSRKTFDLVLNDPLSPTSGFTTFVNNIGSMQNKGIEITMNFVPVKTKDFRWDIGFNGAWNKNKVLSLSASGADIVALPYIRRVGEDYQSIYTRIWAGADPTNGDPLWFTDGTRTKTTNDFTKVTRAIIGSASPKGFGGFNTGLHYKNFSVSANFYYQYGNLINDTWGFIYTSDGASPNFNKNLKQLQRWQKPGDITDVPRYDFNNSTSSNATSTRYFYKGDYIRLRTLLVSYDLPTDILKKAKLNSMSIYLRGNNIWTKTFDKNLAIDPEQPINGAANNQFFIPKSLTAGLNINF